MGDVQLFSSEALMAVLLGRVKLVAEGPRASLGLLPGEFIGIRGVGRVRARVVMRVVRMMWL